jgi:HEAT repeat protein
MPVGRWILVVVAAILAIPVQIGIAGSQVCLDQVVSELTWLLKTGSPIDQIAAAEALGKLGSAALPAVPELIRLLNSSNASLRRAAATALGGIKGDPESVVPQLIRALSDEESEVRAAAAKALGEFGPAAQPAVPSLLRAINEDTFDVRPAAVEALGRIAPPEIAVEPLVQALEDPASWVREAAVATLAAYGKPAVPALIQVLDKEWDVTVEASRALAAIGAQAVPALLEHAATAPYHYGALYAIGEIGPEALPVLIDALHSGSENVRLAAVEAIQEVLKRSLTKGNREVVLETLPELVNALEDSYYPAVRCVAARALGELGVKTEGVTTSLIRALKDSWVAAEAARALGELRCKQAVPYLINILRDPDVPWRLMAEAATALGKIGDERALPDLLETAHRLQNMDLGKLTASDRGILLWCFAKVVEALGMLGDPAAGTALMKLLAYPYSSVKEEAALALMWLGPKVLETLGINAEQLENWFPGIRKRWWKSCVHDGEWYKNEETVPCLIQVLMESDDRVLRIQAVAKLSDLGPAAGKAASALVEVLTDEELDPWPKVALQAIGAAAVPPLIKALEDPSRRKSATDILVRIGPDAIPSLIDALFHPDPEVRERAAYALGEVGSSIEEVIAALSRALDDDDKYVRWRAVQALGKMGPAAGAAIPQLINALRDPEPLVRAEAASALGLIGPAARPAIPYLISAVDDGFRMARQNAVGSLIAIGLAAPDVLPQILRALGEKDLLRVRFPYWALGNMHPDAIPILAEFLVDERESPWVRSWAAIALAEGPAELVVPPLIQALRSKSSEVRRAAIEALEDLGPEAVDAVGALLPLLRDERCAYVAASALGSILQKQSSP